MKIILILLFSIRFLDVTDHLPVLAASYADDILCLPLVLGAVLWCHRRMIQQNKQYVLPASHGLWTLLLFALYFEGLLPRLKASAVADPWDLLMYLVGFLIFQFLMNKPAASIKQDWLPGSA